MTLSPKGQYIKLDLLSHIRRRLSKSF